MIDPYKSKTLIRLKKAKGQIEGLINMVEEDKYCVDILTQALALQGALKGTAYEILESHLHTCGAKKMGSKDSVIKEKFISEIVNACKLSNK